jgi:hypothetical protein
MPLYYVVVLEFIITIIEAPFVSTTINTIVGIRSRPQTLRGIKFVNLPANMP